MSAYSDYLPKVGDEIPVPENAVVVDIDDDEDTALIQWVYCGRVFRAWVPQEDIERRTVQ